MQFVVSGALVLLCALAGRAVANSYRRRERLFDDLKLFCASLKNDILFFQLRLAETFKKVCAAQGKDIVYLCGLCLDAIENSRTVLLEREEIAALGLLNAQDVDLVEQFFNSLGKTDSSTQAERIAAFEKIFAEKASAAKVETKTKGTLFSRLGPFVGLLLAVLCW